MNVWEDYAMDAEQRAVAARAEAEVLAALTRFRAQVGERPSDTEAEE